MAHRIPTPAQEVNSPTALTALTATIFEVWCPGAALLKLPMRARLMPGVTSANWFPAAVSAFGLGSGGGGMNIFSPLPIPYPFRGVAFIFAAAGGPKVESRIVSVPAAGMRCGLLLITKN
jgi:hypothetical protein